MALEVTLPVEQLGGFEKELSIHVKQYMSMFASHLRRICVATKHLLEV
jgi:hypothetical protein